MRTITGFCWMAALGVTGCAHVAPTLYGPMQPDGWSAQPLAIACRFPAHAELDPVTRTPVGDEGYYLYLLTKSGAWDYRTTRSFLLSHIRQQWGHSWLMLESPEGRVECGMNGNFGLEKPDYDEGVKRKARAGDPDPISYLWESMPDGRLEIGNGNRIPTFVWRMPISRQRHARVREYVMQWKFTEIGLQSNNCVDLVTGAAEVAGIGLIHRVRLTLPRDVRILGKTLHAWTDPKYRVMEYSTPDLLEMDLRHVARFGIGTDVTAWYRAGKK